MNFNTYIKSANQLHNTYITNDCPIKRDVYLALCERFGIALTCSPDCEFISVMHAQNSEGYNFTRMSQITIDCKELHLADLVDLHDSYVMTSDFGTAKQFGDLVGDAISGAEFLRYNVVLCRDSNMLEFYHVSESNLSSVVQNKTQLTPDLINAMHAEMVKLKELNDAYADERKPVSLTDFLKRTEPVNSEEKVTPVPKMKVEYVLADDSLWNLQPDFEVGQLYMPAEANGFKQITRDTELAEYFLAENVYRRIEKPVDWREEVVKYLEEEMPCHDLDRPYVKFDDVGVTIDGGMKNEFYLEMCRVALRATGELPDTTK